jgi:hypothetical protein
MARDALEEYLPQISTGKSLISGMLPLSWLMGLFLNQPAK